MFSPEYKNQLAETLGAKSKLIQKVERLQGYLGEKEYLLGYFTIADLCLAGLALMCYNVYKSAGLESPFRKKSFFDHATRVRELPGIKEYYATDEVKNTPVMPMPWLTNHPIVPPEN